MGECFFRGSNSPEGIRKWGSPLILAGLQWEVPTQAFKKGQLPVPQGQSMSAPWFIKYMAIWCYMGVWIQAWNRYAPRSTAWLPGLADVLALAGDNTGPVLVGLWGFAAVHPLGGDEQGPLTSKMSTGWLRDSYDGCVCDLSRWFWDVLDSGGLFAAITAQVLRIWFGKPRFPSPSGYLTQCNKYLT